MVICLERGADLHMAQLMTLPLTVSCFSKIHIGFTFLVPAHLGIPGKRAIKRVCVCVCVFVVKFRVTVVVVYVAASSVNNDEYKLASRKSERLLDGKKFVLIHSEKKNGELIFLENGNGG